VVSDGQNLDLNELRDRLLRGQDAHTEGRAENTTDQVRVTPTGDFVVGPPGGDTRKLSKVPPTVFAL